MNEQIFGFKKKNVGIGTMDNISSGRNKMQNHSI